jgi:pimeloyl-ACP methyl ester carboxylesterase
MLNAVGGVAALAGAVGVAIAGARLRAFYRQLPYSTGEDERLVAETSDGWRIALYRYRPRGTPRPYPVVASHGFAGSHLIYDLTPETSLARYLAECGYDVFTIDLRGRGESWPHAGASRSLHWSFDDFVARDLPAAVAKACAASGADEAFWLGLEMSGQALYAAAISGSAQRVRGAITCGAPVITPASARVPGITAPPKQRSNGRIPFRAGSRFAGPTLALLRSRLLASSFIPANVDPIVPGRYLYAGIPDESTRIADQFTDWVRNGVMRSIDHGVVWSDRLDEVRLPLLICAAARDLQRPAEGERAAYEAFGSADKTFLLAGRAGGFSVDFGHDDLLAGKVSRAEFFPRLRAWLDERSGA